MDSFVNEAITGKYDHVGDAVIYGDTDSVYFSAYSILKKDIDAGNMEWNKEICIQLYDAISDQLACVYGTGISCAKRQRTYYQRW